MRADDRGLLSLVDIGTMATRANVKTLVLTYLTSRAGTDDYSQRRKGVKNTSPAGADREGPDGHCMSVGRGHSRRYCY
jgi:hypothetical protein